MNIQIEIYRLSITLRDARGCYRCLLFSDMPAERAVALLPQYGAGGCEVCDVRRVALRYPFYLDEGRLLTLLLAGRCPEPPRGADEEALRRWLCGVLAPLLPMHAVPASLSVRTVNECVTLIRQNL